MYDANLIRLIIVTVALDRPFYLTMHAHGYTSQEVLRHLDFMESKQLIKLNQLFGFSPFVELDELGVHLYSVCKMKRAWNYACEHLQINADFDFERLITELRQTMVQNIVQDFVEDTWSREAVQYVETQVLRLLRSPMSVEEQRGRSPMPIPMPFERSHNNNCKYYAHNPFIKCAVNPKGNCANCKDYERI